MDEKVRMPKPEAGQERPLASGASLWRLNQLGLLSVRQDERPRQSVSRDDASWLLQRAIENGHASSLGSQ
jgi:hypothetical protein